MAFDVISAKKTYETWDLDTDPSDEIQEWLDWTLNNPDNNELLELSEYFINNFEIEKSTFWLDWSINYLWRGKKSRKKIALLEKILTDYKKYKDSGTSRNRAASVLGDIAPYPNDILRNAVYFNDPGDNSEWNSEAIKQFRATAYGAYIMTATDFQTGLEAGRAIRASGETPSVEKAEQVIAEWRKKHASSST